jgi:hypothetical protein
MSSVLIHLYEQTKQLATSSEQVSVEQWEELVRLRDEVIEHLKIKLVIDPSEKEYIGLIASYDKQIQSRMCECRDEAAHELQVMDQSRKQRMGYDTHRLDDSYFIDIKK